MGKIFYQTIKTPLELEIPKIKWSKFIGNVFHIKKMSDIDSFLQSIKTKYFDARHHCFAYKINDESNNISFKYSDDWEPTWTAWKPIMNIIDRHDISNILIIITRYFGGIKLWHWWLVKAYSDCTKQLIENSIVNKISINQILSFGYTNDYISLMMKLVKDYDIKILNNTFLNWKNKIDISINIWLVNKFKAELLNKSNWNIFD
jgi:uncharacterized YigZ family protein